ncbi:MAG: glycerol-3-phosphate acyltransferase [Armatimonadota bacterium]|nr:glycerol-3-phosphate acyltransferase [Armatimonadota bacterium]
MTLFLSGAILTAIPAWAHQPFFEETDILPDRPWWIDDPSVSTAVYATLESPMDVDVFAFDGRAGQEVYLSIVIPQILGQEDFAPTVALVGPGLPEGRETLPSVVPLAESEGMEVVPPPEGPPSTFFEPFTRTSYWERQERTFAFPADGPYRVAVWHPRGAVGRYVFTVGRAERLGGDPAFMAKLRRYWTPVGAPPPGPPVGAVLLWTVLGFLSGSLPFSVWIGRLVARADIRRYGDGNPGAANTWRAGGWRAGVPALLLEYLKGATPVALARFGAGIDGWGLLSVALAPVLGHAFSPLLRFRGGKAIAVTFGVWSGLTLWAGPTGMGLALVLALAVNRTDAWSAVFGVVVLGAYLLLSGASGPLLAVWVGNLALVLWKHRRDLRTPPRARPWLRRLVGRLR